MDFLGGYDILITRPTLFSCTNSSATQHLETIWYFICDTSKIDSIPPNVGAACMMRMRMHGSLLVCTSTRSVIFEEHATVVRKGLSRWRQMTSLQWHRDVYTALLPTVEMTLRHCNSFYVAVTTSTHGSWMAPVSGHNHVSDTYQSQCFCAVGYIRRKMLESEYKLIYLLSQSILFLQNSC